jgi:hypothetical protein
MRLSKKHFTILALIGIFSVFLFLIGQNVTGAFTGFNEDNNALYALAAQHWLNFGILNMKFGMVIGWLDNLNGSVGYYTHHPSIFVIPTAIIFKLFGVSEFTTRLGPILFSIGSLIVFYKLVEQVYKNRFVSLASTFFLATVPAITFYGKMLDHEIYVLFFSLLSILFFYKHKNNPSNKLLYGLLISIFAGNLMGWHFYFTPLVLWLVIIFEKNHPNRKKLLYSIPFLEFFSAGLIFLQFIILAGTEVLTNLLEAAGSRTGRIPLYRFALRIFDLLKSNFSPHLLGLSMAWLVYPIRTLIKRKKISLEIILLAPAILVIAIFSQWAFVHAYGVFYFAPFIALASGKISFLLFEKLNEFSKSKLIAGFMMLILCLFHFNLAFGLLDNFKKHGDQKESIEIVKRNLSNLNENAFCMINDPSSASYTGIFSYYLRANIIRTEECMNSPTKYIIVFIPKTPEQEKTIDTILRAGYEPLECGSEICVLERK